MSDTIAIPSQEVTKTPAQELKPEPSQLEQIDQLLSGEPIKPEKAPQAEAGREPDAANDGKTPQAEAETHEAEDEGGSGVDYAQEVPLANGEKLTIGALKDYYQAQATRELDMIERENKVMTRYNELQELGQYLQLPDEVRQGIAQQQTEYLREQHGLMLQAIPEWKDQAVFERSRGQIFDLGKEYGVDLSRVSDHRVVKMLNDFAKLRSAIRTAKDTVKPIKGKDPKAPVRVPPGKTGELDNAISTAQKSGNVADQLRAVDMLLKG